MQPSVPLPSTPETDAAEWIGRPKRSWWMRRHGTLLVVTLAAALLGLFVHEARTSALQARLLARLAEQAQFAVEPGASAHIRFPSTGPYDQRLGYTQIPDFAARLLAAGFEIEAQARHSPKLVSVQKLGLFPVYHEKTRAGLSITGRDGQPLFTGAYPRRTYTRFEDVPALVIDALLFVENRELLDESKPHKNPAIEWDRFGRALGQRLLRAANGDGERAGGSTLATQLEKFRHSPQGLTGSPIEKLRQMASASLRAYQDGPETLAARRRVVVDYLNSLPLAAAPPLGEVIGLGDALHVWYRSDFTHANEVLARAADPATAADIESAGRVYKQALSLLLSAGRPSYYLIQDPAALRARTDTYLRLLANEGRISPALRDAALTSELELRRGAAETDSLPEDRKSAAAVRARLVSMLGVSDYYALDRLDLEVESTLSTELQESITRELRELRDPERARAAGFIAPRLLEVGDPSRVIYSFSLYERGQNANHLVVQADNLDQPFDVNDGVKLDLGSTAKLRTLVTYLEVIAELHARFAGRPQAELAALEIEPVDHLTRFAVNALRAEPELSLAALLDQALERRYSASPYEAFFTGGGRHHFANFDKADNERILSVRTAFTHSVNLVFIRLMRDIVRYHVHQAPASSASLLRDPNDPRRDVYLRRFADSEGRLFLDRFWRKYNAKSRAEILESLLRSVRTTPRRVAMAIRAARPEASFEEFEPILHAQLPDATLSPKLRRMLYDSYAPEKYSLADQGYLAGVHPLELWLVNYLGQHPEATLRQVHEASADERIAVYRWLFRKNRRAQQDLRIRSLLEIEAFLEIHRRWQALGYPFEGLVPSLATAIGSAADRPAALAELVGILVNDGVRRPTLRISRLRFAGDTPYETVLRPAPPEGQSVLSPEVARAVRTAMRSVVERGTAVRAFGALRRADGTPVHVGGKTGTGDHRWKTFGPGGKIVESRAINRTATFVFAIEDRWYGVITAYVPGAEAGAYAFTSSLPTQIFKVLAPSLSPLLDEPRDTLARRWDAVKITSLD